MEFYLTGSSVQARSLKLAMLLIHNPHFWQVTENASEVGNAKQNTHYSAETNKQPVGLLSIKDMTHTLRGNK